MACEYNITINGYTKSFNSQKELDDFISKNYTRLKASMQISNVKFSKDIDPKADTLAKIEAIRTNNIAINARYDEFGNKKENNVNTERYKGVTRVIDDMEVNGRKLIIPFNITDYRLRNQMLLRAKYNADPEFKSLTPAQLNAFIDKEISDTIASWKTLGNMGTELHSIAQLFFNDNISNIDELLNRYDKPLDRELMTKYVKFLEEIKQEMIKRSGDPDMTFISELPIHDEKSKIIGIIDLVGIDKNGNSYLGDFKTSYKSVDDWDRSKTLKSEYQLAFYQQLMLSKSIPVSEMYVFPLYLMEADTEKMQVGNIRRESSIALKQMLQVEKRNILENVSNIVPVDMSNMLKYKNDSNMQDQMQKMVGITIGYDNIDAQIPAFITDNVDLLEGKYYYYNAVLNKRIELTGTALEREDQIRIYLKSTVEQTGLYAMSRAESLNNMINTGVYSDLVNSGKDSRKIMLRTAYARYTDGTWEIQDIPELVSQGILTFRNKYKGTLEFVIDSNIKLTQKHNLKYGDTLVSDFYKRDQIKSKNFKALDANEANMAALKILMFLNANHETVNAASSSLGFIRAVNTTSSNMDLVGVEVQDLVANYKLLCNKTGIAFNLDKIKISSFEDLLYSQVVHALQFQTLDPDETSFLEDVRSTFDQPNMSERLATLMNIQKKWANRKDLAPETADPSTPQGYLFTLLNGAILQLVNVKYGYEQDINKVSLNKSEVISSPAELAANDTINAAQYPIRQAMNAMSENYVTFNGKMRVVFDKFYKSKNTSALVGNHLNAFDNLYERDSNGKINKKFRFKNPDDPNSKLSNTERVFLKEILTVINNVMHPGANVDQLKLTGEWYEVPLLRANSVSRLHNKAPLDAVKDSFNRVLNFHNMFDIDQKENMKQYERMLSVHDSFASSKRPDLREKLLIENPMSEFDTNLELILGQLVFSDIRKKAYDQVLPIIFAVRIVSKFMSTGLLNKPLENLDRYIKEYVKVSVFDEKILEPAHENVAKVVMSAKSFVTGMQLALTPLNLIKETMQGQFNNMSKLMAGQYGKTGASMANYARAVNYIIGEGPDFIKNVTMVEELNHFYGMANMDRHQLAEKMKLSKQGLTNFSSRWLLWASGAPDYINRMSLFVAQMMEDGSFEAHTMKDGILNYDWKKDKRFSDYANDRKQSVNYNKQRSLYLAVLAEHNKDAIALGEPQLEEGDALRRAYTTKERESFKMFSNYVHGPYDHEDKIKLNHMLLGGLFIQFKTWLTAKKQQYTMAGDVYAIGHFEHSKDIDGNLEYLKPDGEGGLIITTEKTDLPYTAWKGRFMEGLFQSVIRTYGEFKKSEYSVNDLVNFLKQDETIKGNFKMMSFDLALFTIFSLLIKGMIDWGELAKDEPQLSAVMRAAVNSTSDMNPWANIKTAIDPKALTATINSVTKSTEDIFGAMVGDVGFSKVVRNFGIGRTIDDLTSGVSK